PQDSLSLLVSVTLTLATRTDTLSLHDALPISARGAGRDPARHRPGREVLPRRGRGPEADLGSRAARPVGVPVREPHDGQDPVPRSEEHTSELQSRVDLVCRLLLEKKKVKIAAQ